MQKVNCLQPSNSIHIALFHIDMWNAGQSQSNKVVLNYLESVIDTNISQTVI